MGWEPLAKIIANDSMAIYNLSTEWFGNGYNLPNGLGMSWLQLGQIKTQIGHSKLRWMDVREIGKGGNPTPICP